MVAKGDDYKTGGVVPDELKAEHPREFFLGLTPDSPPPTLAHPVRKIAFHIRSHDQGWGGQVEDHNTFRGSWTWFEVGLERYDSEAECASAPRPPPSSLSP